MEDQYVWIPLDDLSRSEDEIKAVAVLMGVDATRIGFVWQGRSDDATKLRHFREAVTYLKYDKAQQPDDDDDQ